MTKIQKLLMVAVAAGALLTAGVSQAQDAPHHAAHHHGHKHHAKKHHGHKHHGHAAVMHHDDHATASAMPSDNRNHDFDNLNR